MTPVLKPQPHGGALLPGGQRGHKGGVGRLTKELKDFFAEFVRDEKHVAAVHRVMRNDKHPQFGSVSTLIYAYAFGKPKESVEFSGSVGAVVEHLPMAILFPPLEQAPPVPPVSAPPVSAPPVVALPYSVLPPDLTLAPDVAVEDSDG